MYGARRPPFGEAIGLVLRCWIGRIRLCLLLTLPFALLAGVAAAVLDQLADALSGLRGGSLTALIAMGVGTTAAVGTFLLAFAVLYPLTLAGLAVVGSQTVFGVPVTVDVVGSRLAERGPQAVGAFLLSVIVVMSAPLALGALALVAGIAVGPLGGVAFGVPALIAVIWPGLFLLVRLSLAVPAAIVENVGVAGALGRSNELVRGAFWWVLGLLAVAVVMGSLFGSVLATAAGTLGGGLAVDVLSQSLALVVSASLGGVAGGVVYAARSIPEPREVGVSGAAEGVDREEG